MNNSMYGNLSAAGSGYGSMNGNSQMGSMYGDGDSVKKSNLRQTSSFKSNSSKKKGGGTADKDAKKSEGGKKVTTTKSATTSSTSAKPTTTTSSTEKKSTTPATTAKTSSTTTTTEKKSTAATSSTAKPSSTTATTEKKTTAPPSTAKTSAVTITQVQPETKAAPAVTPPATATAAPATNNAPRAANAPTITKAPAAAPTSVANPLSLSQPPATTATAAVPAAPMPVTYNPAPRPITQEYDDAVKTVLVNYGSNTNINSEVVVDFSEAHGQPFDLSKSDYLTHIVEQVNAGHSGAVLSLCGDGNVANIKYTEAVVTTMATNLMTKLETAARENQERFNVYMTGATFPVSNRDINANKKFVRKDLFAPLGFVKAAQFGVNPVYGSRLVNLTEKGIKNTNDVRSKIAHCVKGFQPKKDEMLVMQLFFTQIRTPNGRLRLFHYVCLYQPPPTDVSGGEPHVQHF
ncbi:hypothetical protein AGDE_16169 [Angomonas deanei]|nr:hypothetical protein AGDE_16169 [Angomonas deanei]|eukprot:EPY17586.1 hypothetical protein AGDE_16169 [Angomonas deanei]